MNGGIELPLELGPREPQRFERPQSFGIANGPRVFLGALVLRIFHALLNPRLSVDQSFARVSHAMISSLFRAALVGPAGFPSRRTGLRAALTRPGRKCA